MAEEQILGWRIKVLGTDAQTKQLSQLETQIKQLNATTKRYEKSTAALRQEGKENTRAHKTLTKSIQENRTATLQLSEQKKKLATNLRLEAKIAQSAAGSLERLKLQQQQLITKTRQLNVTTKAGAAQFKRNTAQIAQNRATLKKYDQQIAGTAAQSKRSFGLIGSLARSLGPTLIAAFGIGALIRFGKAIVNTQKDFERAMSGVSAISQATGAEMEKLTALAKQMGEETVFSATEAAQAMKLLAQAGFSVVEVTQALPGVLNLAASAGIDLAQAADISANALRAYGFDASEIGKVNDIMVGTFTKANLNITDFNEAFKLIAPISKGVGISMEQTAAAIGTLADAGLKGSLGGTALRKAIASLLNPTGATAQVIKKLGLQFNDSEGNLKDFAGIIQELEEAGADTASIMALFGNRAGPAMKVLVDKGSASLRDFTTELENSGGIAERVAEEQLDNLAGDVVKLGSAAEGLAIKIGEKLNPTLRSLATAANFVVSNFGTFLKILGVAGAAVAGYAIITKGLTVIKGAYTLIVNGATAAQKAFTLALKANPVGLVVGLLAAATAAYFAFRDEVKKGAKEIDIFAGAHGDFNKELVKEEAQLKSLFDTAKAANIGTAQRSVAITEINRLYGKYLENLLTEKSTLEEIAIAQDIANRSLVKDIALKAKQAEIVKANTDLIKAQREVHNFVTEATKKNTKVTAAAFQDLQKDLDKTNKFFSVFPDTFETEVKRGQQAIELIKKFGNSFGITGVALVDFRGKMNDLADTQKVASASVNETTEFYDSFIEGLGLVETVVKDKVIKSQREVIDVLAETKKALKENEEFYKRQGAIVEINQSRALMALRKSLQEGEISEGAFRRRAIELDELKDKVLLDNQRDFLTAKLALVKKGSADEAEILAQLEAIKVTQTDKEIEIELQKNDVLNRLRLIRAQNNEERREIEFEQLLLQQEEEIELFSGTLEQKALLEEEHRLQQEELEQEHQAARLANWAQFLAGVQQGITIFANFTKAAQNKAMSELNDRQKEELKAFDKSQAAQLKTFVGTSQEKEEFIKKQEEARAEFLKVQAQKEENLRKDQARKQKQIAILQAIISGALAIVQTFASVTPPPVAAIMAIFVAAVTASQIAVISSQKIKRGAIIGGANPTKLAEGAVLDGPSHDNGGIRTSDGQYEFEGGEAVINKRSTSLFAKELSDINSFNGYGRALTAKRGTLIGSAPRAPVRYQRGGIAPVSQSQSLGTEEVAEMFGEIVSERINALDVTNNVTDTTEQQTNLTNLEQEVNF